jgi:hypothetical protein
VMIPKAIPSELLMSWATKPTRLTANNVHMRSSIDSALCAIVLVEIEKVAC